MDKWQRQWLMYNVTFTHKSGSSDLLQTGAYCLKSPSWRCHVATSEGDHWRSRFRSKFGRSSHHLCKMALGPSEALLVNVCDASVAQLNILVTGAPPLLSTVSCTVACVLYVLQSCKSGSGNTIPYSVHETKVETSMHSWNQGQVQCRPCLFTKRQAAFYSTLLLSFSASISA